MKKLQKYRNNQQIKTTNRVPPDMEMGHSWSVVKEPRKSQGSTSPISLIVSQKSATTMVASNLRSKNESKQFHKRYNSQPKIYQEDDYSDGQNHLYMPQIQKSLSRNSQFKTFGKADRVKIAQINEGLGSTSQRSSSGVNDITLPAIRGNPSVIPQDNNELENLNLVIMQEYAKKFELAPLKLPT